MNPLTQVKNTQKATQREVDAGIQDGASWHARYKESAYIFTGGLPYDLTEGDLLAVFAQYGEMVDVNLVRDRDTGKSRGFAFLAYADQRSTVLAVDNFNGTVIGGRTIRVDHVADYKKKKEEDEEEAMRAREERGVCHAFQRGECKRGGACKYSHNLERAANTGWNEEEERKARARELGGHARGGSSGRWANDLYEGGHSKEMDFKGKAGQSQRTVDATEQSGAQRPPREPPVAAPGCNPWEGSVFQLLRASTAGKHPKNSSQRQGEGEGKKEGAEQRTKEGDAKGYRKQDTQKNSDTRHDQKRSKRSPGRDRKEEESPPWDAMRLARVDRGGRGFAREDLSGGEDGPETAGSRGVEREKYGSKSRRDRGRGREEEYEVAERQERDKSDAVGCYGRGEETSQEEAAWRERTRDGKTGIETSKHGWREHENEKDHSAERRRSREEGIRRGERDRRREVHRDTDRHHRDRDRHQHRDPDRKHKHSDTHGEKDRDRHYQLSPINFCRHYHLKAEARKAETGTAADARTNRGGISVGVVHRSLHEADCGKWFLSCSDLRGALKRRMDKPGGDGDLTF
ncbi:hypothetical protein CBR_g921 [Chara braunii]|uniref:RRM domain-containing protein n=1 Tax=Chara braunii TaxID=69332 RepID=A0A388KCR3_CHABU|nr:hypothetical protein CBR_g921 [Chara braunii]|eukprot:GBG67797.1 hypothetical protein CBR_g921 [Chara braunii]